MNVCPFSFNVIPIRNSWECEPEIAWKKQFPSPFVFIISAFDPKNFFKFEFGSIFFFFDLYQFVTVSKILKNFN